MKNQFFVFVLIVFFLCGFVLAQMPQNILPVDQIEAGMKGKGKTVFRENQIEEFDVEILGVLRNFQPKKSLILARLENSTLNRTGVIQGMSGSPVYVQGKLIGAVAYSIGDFAKEPIAGITPISEMLSITHHEKPQASFSPRIQITKNLTLDRLFELNKDVFQSRSATVNGQIIKPLAVPLLFSGFSSHVFDQAKPLFSRLGFLPVQAGRSSQLQSRSSLVDRILEAGSPVGVKLIDGDMNVSAVGTVTHVDGKRIFAFGHPLYNLGGVDYAMTGAEVMTIIPSLLTSFKVATTTETVGRFFQDRTSGMLGELGEEPEFIALNFKLLEASQKPKEFKVQLVDDKLLTPLLVNLVSSNIISIEERSLGDLTLELSGNIYLENGMSVHLEDLYTGNLDAAVSNLSGLVTAVTYLLTNNEFKDLAIHRIDLNISVVEEVRFASLEKVWLSKYEGFPGERIPLNIYYRNFRGEILTKEYGIPVPHLPSGSEFSLVIGDALSIHNIEVRQYKTTTFVPRSLHQLIRILNNLRKNNRIYIKIIAAKPGLFLKGEEMPSLPPSMKSMFSSPRAASSIPTEITRSTLGEFQDSIPYVFRGLAVVQIKVK